MSINSNEQTFKVIFHGPVDHKIETLQRVKGVLIADLNLTIPQVQEILDNVPRVVCETSERLAADNCALLLKRAGALIEVEGVATEETTLIVSSQSDRSHAELELDLDHNLETEEYLDDSNVLAADEDPVEVIPFEFQSTSDKVVTPPTDAGTPQVVFAVEEPIFELDSQEDEDPNSDDGKTVDGEPYPDPVAAEPLIQLDLGDDARFTLDDNDPEDLNDPATEASNLEQTKRSAKTDDVSNESVFDLQELSNALDAAMLVAETTTPLMVSPSKEPIEEPAIEDDLSIQLEEVLPTPSLDSTPALEPIEAPAKLAALPSEDRIFERVAPDFGSKLVIKSSDNHSANVKQATAIEDEQDGSLSQPLLGPKPPQAGERVFSTEIIIVTIVLSTLLIAGNVYFQMRPPPVPQLKIPDQFLTQTADDHHLEPAALPAPMFNGQAEPDVLKAEVKVSMGAAAPGALTVKFSTPESPELTPEEIVTRQMRTPWISYGEIDNLPLITGDDGSITGSAEARIQIFNKQITAPVSFTGRWDKREQELRGKLNIAHNSPLTDQKEGFQITRIDKDNFRFYVGLKILATRPKASTKNNGTGTGGI